MIFDTEQYLRSRYKDYYQNHFVSVPEVEKREFGIGVYGKKISNRHLEFKNNYELNDYLRREVPFYVSCSVGYYRKPGARPMQAKEMEGGDFIFEFDADDLPTKCKDKHDYWYCAKCSCQGSGRLTTCPNCKSNTKIYDYICDDCLEETKKQTKLLISILINELGFKESELFLSFSGHKGYHIKIKSEKVYSLNQEERMEIIDYITKTGLSFKKIGYAYPHIRFLDLETKAKFSEFFKALKTKNFISMGLDKSAASKAVKYKQDILRGIEKHIAVSLAHDDEKSRIAWDKIIGTFLNKLRETSQLLIDANTSVDIFKIVRVPNTIHGGACLISKELKLSDLDSFSPFRDAYPFNKNGDIKIYIEKMPRLKLNGKEYGPYYKEPVELPENIAIYLLAKGAADGVIL